MSMLLRRYHDTEGSEAEVLERPAKSAAKGDWAAYAVQEGHDVEGLKKDDIVALFPEDEEAEDESPADEEAPAEEAPAADAEPEEK
jgi:hypothetical protein